MVQRRKRKTGASPDDFSLSESKLVGKNNDCRMNVDQHSTNEQRISRGRQMVVSFDDSESDR